MVILENLKVKQRNIYELSSRISSSAGTSKLMKYSPQCLKTSTSTEFDEKFLLIQKMIREILATVPTELINQKVLQEWRSEMGALKEDVSVLSYQSQQYQSIVDHQSEKKESQLIKACLESGILDYSGTNLMGNSECSDDMYYVVKGMDSLIEDLKTENDLLKIEDTKKTKILKEIQICFTIFIKNFNSLNNNSNNQHSKSHERSNINHPNNNQSLKTSNQANLMFFSSLNNIPDEKGHKSHSLFADKTISLISNAEKGQGDFLDIFRRELDTVIHTYEGILRGVVPDRTVSRKQSKNTTFHLSERSNIAKMNKKEKSSVLLTGRSKENTFQNLKSQTSRSKNIQKSEQVSELLPPSLASPLKEQGTNHSGNSGLSESVKRMQILEQSYQMLNSD